MNKTHLAQIKYFLSELREEYNKQMSSTGNKFHFYETEEEKNDKKLKKAFEQGLLAGQILIADFLLDEIEKMEKEEE